MLHCSGYVFSKGFFHPLTISQANFPCALFYVLCAISEFGCYVSFLCLEQFITRFAFPFIYTFLCGIDKTLPNPVFPTYGPSHPQLCINQNETPTDL